MKKSEEFEEQASHEDNDFKALHLHTKAIREARLERFEELHIKEQLEKKNCIVVPFDGKKIVIDTQTKKWGILDYYPKANRVLIRKDNHWESMGLKWIVTNLLSK